MATKKTKNAKTPKTAENPAKTKRARTITHETESARERHAKAEADLSGGVVVTLKKTSAMGKSETMVETVRAVERKPHPKVHDVGDRSIAPDATLYEIACGWLQSMRADGATEATLDGYEGELRTAWRELGSDTPVATLTRDRVLEFLTSPPVCLKKDGTPKASPGVDKTRRALIMSLRWYATETRCEMDQALRAEVLKKRGAFDL